MNILSTKYRITYEAFSKLSGHISKANNIEELVLVTSKNLKYLLDFQLFRISIVMHDKTHSFTFFSKNCSNQAINDLYGFEIALLDKKIPFKNANIPQKFDQFLDLNTLANPLVWGWFFNHGTIKICASLVSDDTKIFSKTDIDILHLLVDNFTTKFQQLHLADQLLVKNKNLEEAVKLIVEKNEEIEKILGRQKNIIIDRTKEVELKNIELLEVSKINAHDLREPLSRILGLIEISEYYEPEQLKDNILKHLKTSASELDEILKDVVKMSVVTVKKLSTK